MNGQENYEKARREEKSSTRSSRHISQHKKHNLKILKRLCTNLALSSFFMTGEIIGGVLSNSIAIITDAFYFFTYILSFIVSIVSLKLTEKPANHRATYGYYRAEVISSLISITIIWGVTIWLLAEAVIRFKSPVKIEGEIMLITSLFGLAGNIVIGIIFLTTSQTVDQEEENEVTVNTGDREDWPKYEKKTKKSLDLRTSILHVIGDSIHSAGVCIAGGVICAKESYVIADPICTVIFCFAALCTTIPILIECVGILMENSPKEIDVEELQNTISEIEDVVSVHDLHIWSLSSGKIAFSCHLVSSSHMLTLSRVTSVIKEKFNVNHLTLQIETVDPESGFACENNLHK